MNAAPAIYRGTAIRFDSNELINLTDMWKATGQSRHSSPNYWLDQDGTRNLLKALEKDLNTAQDGIYKTKRGRNGGTYAVPKLALAYATYLSPEFHVWTLGVIKERFEGITNPELDIKRTRERAIKSWKNKGWDDNRIAARLSGIDTRNVFTSTLAEHGVKGREFSSATNSTYIALFGGNAKDLRQDRDLPKKTNLREHVSNVELSAIQLVEAMASEVIEEEGRHGVRDCCRAIVKTGAAVAPVLEKFKKMKAV